MKSKLRFIMPRLVGATIAAGLAALVITTLFKLLIGLTLLAGAIAVIARSFARRGKLPGKYMQQAIPDFNRWNAFGASNAGVMPVEPGTGFTTQRTSIVPID